MKFGCYFARAIAGWFAGLTALVVVLALAWSSTLPLPRSGVPAPWTLAGPMFFVACAITWARSARRGELVGLAAAGADPRRVVLPVVGLGLLLQILFALPAGGMPATRPAMSGVQRSVQGDLFVVQAGRGVLLTAAGETRVTAPAPPVGFRAAPHDPRRYRRQAFFTHAPRPWRQDRLDPWLLRLLFALAVVVVPALLIVVRQRRTWWWGATPFLLLLGLL